MNENDKNLLNEIQDVINKHEDINSKVNEENNDYSALRYLHSFPNDSNWIFTILALALLNSKPEKQEQPVINIYLNTDSKPEVKNGN